MDLKKILSCNKCSSKNINHVDEDFLLCNSCNNKIKKTNHIYRFVESTLHDNFGFQWNKFSKVQLDSRNGSDESEKRLLFQSKLNPNDFKDKLILEAGCGNGRFTEIFLKYGAKVVAFDYSSAVEANMRNHKEHIKNGNLLLLQADVFNMPFKKNNFDYVFCYGVIQHTGDNEKCIAELSKFPKVKGGMLFMDIYSNSLKHYNPWIYFIMFIYRITNTPHMNRWNHVKSFVKKVYPLQIKILTYLHNRKGIKKYLKYIINRSPNSVYGINLYLDGKIDLKTAYDWSYMETFDAWAPSYDHPVSLSQWERLLSALNDKYKILHIGESGQGNIASLEHI